LRILLWKNFYQKFSNLKPPKFGLNFLEDKKYNNQNFMLLCGFEKFDRFFVRIDILERLFIHIIKSNTEKIKEVKIVPEMLNLLGCSKENFIKLVKCMDYQSFIKENEVFIKYVPKKTPKKNKRKNIIDNPFSVLNQLNIK